MSKARDLGSLARRYSYLDTIDDTDVLNDLSDDLTPQLGGDLDLNSNDITGTGNINITGSITSTSISTSGDLTFGDNDKAIFGAGSDLQIYHDGFNSVIADKGTGHLQLTAPTFRLRNDAQTQEMLSANEGGAVTAYYAGSQKLATTATGIDVTGTVTPLGCIM